MMKCFGNYQGDRICDMYLHTLKDTTSVRCERATKEKQREEKNGLYALIKKYRYYQDGKCKSNNNVTCNPLDEKCNYV
jgi:hypothetical protein